MSLCFQTCWIAWGQASGLARGPHIVRRLTGRARLHKEAAPFSVRLTSVSQPKQEHEAQGPRQDVPGNGILQVSVVQIYPRRDRAGPSACGHWPFQVNIEGCELRA